MNIRNLAAINTKDIVKCLLSAFSNYFVSLPQSVVYWETRFKAARVDRNLSFGMFDEDKLVGFIITGIDEHEGKLTAFNSGTGVLPEYRGTAIVDKLYEHAIPIFKNCGVEKCMLEVIQENERAINVYRRIGFQIKRNLTSWKGVLPETDLNYRLNKVDFQHILDLGLYRAEFYSWDNLSEAVQLSEDTKDSYLITDEKEKLKGYFTVGGGGQIVQLHAVENGDLSEVIKSLSNISPEIKFGNIPQERDELLSTIKSFGFKNTVNQYEMEFFL